MLNLIFAFILFLGILSAGRFALKAFKIKDLSPAEKFLISYGMGFGLYGTLIFIFGLFGMLKVTIWVLFSIGIICTVLSYKYLSYLRRIAELVNEIRNSPYFILPAITFGIFILINTINSMAPISAPDALNYHIALPKIYLSSGKIIHLKGFLYSHIAQLSEIMNAYALCIHSDITAAILNSFWGLLLAFFIFYAASRFFDKHIALLVSLLFYSMPLLTWEVSGLFVELQLAFFCLASIYLLIRYFQNGSFGFLILSAIFLGFAHSTKLLAIFYLFIMTLYFAFNIVRESQRKKVFKGYMIWLFVAAVFGSPWYFFNLIKTGNPIFPIFYGIFGGSGWNPGSDMALSQWLAVYGNGKSLLSFLKLPFDITLKGFAFDQAELIGPVSLCFAALSFLEKDRKKVIFISSIILLYLIFWFFGSPQARFLIPVIPFIFLLAAIGVQNLIQLRLIFITALTKATIIIFVAFSLILSIWYCERYFKVVFHLEKRQQFLRKTVKGYDYLLWMNKNLKKNDKVLFFGNGPYYLDIPYITGKFATQGLIDYTKIKDENTLLEKIESIGITHIFVWKRFIPVKKIDQNLWIRFVDKYLIKILYDKNAKTIMGGKEFIDLSNSGILYKVK